MGAAPCRSACERSAIPGHLPEPLQGGTTQPRRGGRGGTRPVECAAPLAMYLYVARLRRTVAEKGHRWPHHHFLPACKLHQGGHVRPSLEHCPDSSHCCGATPWPLSHQARRNARCSSKSASQSRPASGAPMSRSCQVAAETAMTTIAAWLAAHSPHEAAHTEELTASRRGSTGTSWSPTSSHAHRRRLPTVAPRLHERWRQHRPQNIRRQDELDDHDHHATPSPLFLLLPDRRDFRTCVRYFLMLLAKCNSHAIFKVLQSADGVVRPLPTDSRDGQDAGIRLPAA